MLAHWWQTIPERGVVKSREPLKFRWAPTISLERADRLRCGQLRWTVSVVNWWPSSVIVYHTDRRYFCTARWARGTESRGSVSGSGDLFVHVAFGRGSVLLRHRCDTLCTSGFLDDILLFSHNGPVWVSLGRTDFASIYLFTVTSNRIQFPIIEGRNFNCFEITGKLK